MRKRFQNKIAESRFALTVALIVCLPVWVANSIDLPMLLAGEGIFIEPKAGIGVVCLLLATFFMVRLNNVNALLRIYSRMVSCSFLVMMTTAIFLHAELETGITTLCVAFFLHAIFHTYQDRQATGWTFYAFLALSANSIVFPQVALFIPLLWILMVTRLQSMSLKTFCASILGLLLPYWIAACCIAYWHMSLPTTFFYQPFDYSNLDLREIVTAAFVLLCSLIGITHYLRTRQQDRIRTQLLYEMIITLDIFAILFLTIQPQHYNALIGVIIANTAPLIAHFIALTHTKWTNILTKLLIILAIAVTAFSLLYPHISYLTTWNPLLNY